MKFEKVLVLFVSIIVVLTGCKSEPKESSKTSSITPSETQLPSDIPSLDEDSIQIHYKRQDKSYSSWTLWLWHDDAEGEMYDFNYQDSFGVIASYKLSEIGVNSEVSELGFIVRKKTSWTKDVDSDRFINFSSFEKDEAGVYHVYLFSGDANIYSTADKTMADKIVALQFVSTAVLNCKTNNPMAHIQIIENNNIVLDRAIDNLTNFTTSISDFSFAKPYIGKITFASSNKTLEQGVSIQKLFASTEFNNAYYYDGELGALYTAEKTTFKVWSPVSTKIVLKIYNNGTPTIIDSTNGSDEIYREVEMTKEDKGVFVAEISENLEGKYYTYTVFNGTYPNGRETVDPYAKSTGINGLRGMIVDFSKTNPEGWENINAHAYDRKELTVWETHVADVTSSATWTGSEENRKRYLGLVEENTTYSNGTTTVKTGFDHIKELGVNAVQLIPIYDQANDEVNPQFNWGYNPLNYNSLEGAYSKNPYDGYEKIKEFKTVVKKFNTAGINIIMDVVYNHTSGLKGSNFDIIVPGYYYRYDNNGNALNGSGCGNETASNNLMMRKFMIDSTCFWASEYKLGGFRFDLMGLHDIETMNELTAEVKKINPSITIYGEPWTAGTSGLPTANQAIQENGNSFVGFGQFNDRLRDELIKGGLNSAITKSWISDVNGNESAVNMESLTNGIKGITSASHFSIADPDKTVNYVTCHDNYTLYDRFKAAGITDETLVKKMAMLANSVVFTSQGTTFMLAGEEMLRTKQGDFNSYESSYEINELDYALKITNHDMFTNYQKLISLKQTVDGLHLNKDQIEAFIVTVVDDGHVIQYKITDSVNNKEYFIIHSNGVNTSNRTSIDLTGYALYLDTLNELPQTLGVVTVKGFQTIIVVK